MERVQLLDLLHGQGEATDACWAAVNAGAEFRIFDGKVPAHDLFDIYSFREKHVARIGLPSIGFAEAVSRLGRRGQDSIVLGLVRAAEPPYFFQLFLTEDTLAIVACIGVERRSLPARASSGSGT